MQHTAIMNPPRIRITDDRPLASVFNCPTVGFYDPNALNYRNTQLPTVPGNGNITLGAGMVVYNGQPTWNRAAGWRTGPVRQFFRDLLGSRGQIKHN